MNEIVQKFKDVLAEKYTGKLRDSRVSVGRLDVMLLLRKFEQMERAISKKIWSTIQRIECDAAKDIAAPKPCDTKFFVAFVNEKMDFVWYEKSQVHKFSDGGFFIRDVWAWELESSGLTVVREDGEQGELLRPCREARI
jgi:hypothetical protein